MDDRGRCRRDASHNRDGSVDPTFFWSIRQWSLLRMEVVVRRDVSPAYLANAVSAVVRMADPSLPSFEVTPLEQSLRELDGPRRFQTGLLGVFAASALLLAAVGLYGLVSSSLAQRTREIGIRIALGATPSNVLRLIVREGLLCSTGGIGNRFSGRLPPVAPSPRGCSASQQRIRPRCS